MYYYNHTNETSGAQREELPICRFSRVFTYNFRERVDSTLAYLGTYAYIYPYIIINPMLFA
jgi:hypothetical protein